MLSLDISAALASTITPSKGIPDSEFTTLATRAKRIVESWLKGREHGEHAWSMDPYDKRAVEKVKDVVEYAQQAKLHTVVWVGIGGSGLGPKVIQECFEGPDTMEFILLDTIDPSVLATYQDIIDWKKTLLVVVSKSGGTLEPMSVFFWCWEQLKAARGEHAAEQVVGVTDPHGGILRSFCIENNIQMLPIPTGVGGRYSIFTPVGLLPMALLGGDIDEFVRGAKEMDTLCQHTELHENPALLLAAAQFVLESKRDYPIRVIMPYIQRLESLARWNQQLVAESLGKSETHNPIPVAAIGTQDQHSLLQQWLAGPRSCFHLFIRDKKKIDVKVPKEVEESFKYIAGKSFGELLDACYEGTSGALTSDKRPHATITIEQLDEYHLGQIFFLLLCEVVFMGGLYRIDPYGQPAVEVGKTITKEILSGE